MITPLWYSYFNKWRRDLSIDMVLYSVNYHNCREVNELWCLDVSKRFHNDSIVDIIEEKEGTHYGF